MQKPFVDINDTPLRCHNIILFYFLHIVILSMKVVNGQYKNITLELVFVL